MRVVFWALAACALNAQVISDWAFEGPDHRLHYRYDTRLNSIMDFSWAGYRAGGVKLPSAAAAQRLTPVTGDNTARIQAALDQATGAVVLAPGEYDVAGTVRITRSGVVLRGEKGASVRLTGQPHRFLEIRGMGAWREEGSPAPILDPYVPSGALSIHVRGASAFHSGEHVLVLRPVTAEWIRFMGMDQLVRGSQPQSWIHPGAVIRTDRVVDYIHGDLVTLDVPLSDALDSRFTAASLVPYSFPGRITEAGVEGLRITAPPEDGYEALLMDAVEDGWARDLDIRETQNGVAIGPRAKRITLSNIRITHSVRSTSDPPADFVLSGTQILVDRCQVTGEVTWAAATEAEAIGPLVLLNFTADHGGVAPRQPWATGLLVDGGKFPGATEGTPGVAFSNRAAAGSGPTWDIGWSVAWNVVSPFFLIPQPPGAMNWCIGCIGTAVKAGSTPMGVFDSPGKPVAPPSLYLHQLHDRRPDALRDIGY
jgi:hypothetical protein